MLVQPKPEGYDLPEPGLCPKRKKRVGATAIEYLFMISLILVVCIVLIQHLGSVARDLFKSNANSTSVMDVGKK